MENVIDALIKIHDINLLINIYYYVCCIVVLLDFNRQASAM